MIDPNVEQLLSLTDAAKRVPRIGRRKVHTSTIYRWCRRGIRGVHLEYVRVGHRMATSSEALTRFFNRLAEADKQIRPENPARSPRVSPTTAERARQITEAERKLDEAGLYDR